MNRVLYCCIFVQRKSPVLCFLSESLHFTDCYVFIEKDAILMPIPLGEVLSPEKQKSPELSSPKMVKMLSEVTDPDPKAGKTKEEIALQVDIAKV